MSAHMPPTYIIGLCGFAAAGKDTVADYLVKHAGFTKLAFADALRWEVAEAFHVEPLVLRRREMKETPLAELALQHAPMEFCDVVHDALTAQRDTPLTHPEWVAAWQQPRTPRQILQWWGTEYRRAEDPDYWVDRLHDTVLAHIDRGLCRFVITDVRFDNEVGLLRPPVLGRQEHTTQLWQVQRPGVTAATTTEGTHASATDGAAFRPDVTITNASTLDDLRNQVLSQWWALEAGLDSVQAKVA